MPIFSSAKPLLQMGDRTSVLHASLGLGSPPSLPPGCLLLILDTLQAKGEFLLHHLAQAHLAKPTALLLWVALSQSLTHHASVAKKLGCNWTSLQQAGRLKSVDCMSNPYSRGEIAPSLRPLYETIAKATRTFQPQGDDAALCVVIDDASLLEVAARGSTQAVLDLLHYCRTLRPSPASSVLQPPASRVMQRCSVILLHHRDVAVEHEPSAVSALEHWADVVVAVDPLSSGQSSDIHGQIFVSSGGGLVLEDGARKLPSASPLLFHIAENQLQFFRAGSQA